MQTPEAKSEQTPKLGIRISGTVFAEFMRDKVPFDVLPQRFLWGANAVFQDWRLSVSQEVYECLKDLETAHQTILSLDILVLDSAKELYRLPPIDEHLPTISYLSELKFPYAFRW